MKDSFCTSGNSPTALQRKNSRHRIVRTASPTPDVSTSQKGSAAPVVSPIDPSQILTLDELATRLKVSKRWVYEKSRRRCLDPLPVIRIGRHLRANWLDVSEWLRQHTNMSAPSGRRVQ